MPERPRIHGNAVDAAEMTVVADHGAPDDLGSALGDGQLLRRVSNLTSEARRGRSTERRARIPATARSPEARRQNERPESPPSPILRDTIHPKIPETAANRLAESREASRDEPHTDVRTQTSRREPPGEPSRGCRRQRRTQRRRATPAADPTPGPLQRSGTRKRQRRQEGPCGLCEASREAAAATRAARRAKSAPADKRSRGHTAPRRPPPPNRPRNAESRPEGTAFHV